MKSGNLNFLEPSGPLQACNGTDLPKKVRTFLEILAPSVLLFFLCLFSQKPECGVRRDVRGAARARARVCVYKYVHLC